MTASRPAPWPGRLAVVFVLAGAIAALWSLRQEAVVARSEAVLAGQAQAVLRGQPSSGAVPPVDATLTARALVHVAQTLLLELPHADASRRRAILRTADEAITLALRRRPHWGEAELVRASIEAQRGPAGIAAMRDALIASYDDAPYLRGGSDWRIPRTLALWDTLPPRTRDRVVNEAAWVLRLRADRRDIIFDMMRASPAYVPFMLRWRQVRRLDPDLVPN